jgi:hypothetical protein
MPADPAGQTVAGFHSYNDNWCNNPTCWDGKVGRVAATVPVVTGELGENDCAHAYIDSFMNWADQNGVSYLGWSWNPFSCTDQPALITSYNGAPTNYGIGLRDHLAQLAAAPTTTTTTAPPTTTTTVLTTTTTTMPPAPIRYDFESGTAQGWHRAWGPVAVAATTSAAHTGSWGVGATLTPTGADWPAVEVGTPPGLTPGSRVTFWVYAPAGSTLSSVQPYVADLSWNDIFGSATKLSSGWNAVSFTVPSVSGINTLGLQFNDDTGWNGQVVVDTVSW